MFNFFKTLFLPRLKAWAAAASGALVSAGFAYLNSKGLGVDVATQATVTAGVVGFVTHQVDNVSVALQGVK